MGQSRHEWQTVRSYLPGEAGEPKRAMGGLVRQRGPYEIEGLNKGVQGGECKAKAHSSVLAGSQPDRARMGLA